MVAIKTPQGMRANLSGEVVADFILIVKMRRNVIELSDIFSQGQVVEFLENHPEIRYLKVSAELLATGPDDYVAIGVEFVS